MRTHTHVHRYTHMPTYVHTCTWASLRRARLCRTSPSSGGFPSWSPEPCAGDQRARTKRAEWRDERIEMTWPTRGENATGVRLCMQQSEHPNQVPHVVLCSLSPCCVQVELESEITDWIASDCLPVGFSSNFPHPSVPSTTTSTSAPPGGGRSRGKCKLGHLARGSYERRAIGFGHMPSEIISWSAVIHHGARRSSSSAVQPAIRRVSAFKRSLNRKPIRIRSFREAPRPSRLVISERQTTLQWVALAWELGCRRLGAPSLPPRPPSQPYG